MEIELELLLELLLLETLLWELRLDRLDMLDQDELERLVLDPLDSSAGPQRSVSRPGISKPSPSKLQAW